MSLLARKKKENVPEMNAGKCSKRSSIDEDTPVSASPSVSRKKMKLTTLETEPAEEVNTQQILSGSSLAAPDETATLAGRILEVHVQNFLVYKKKSFKFGPFVNFITGPNGSGKSSVASAISIGLGQRCSATDRGGKLEDMIRTGCKTAEIRVILSNEGFHAVYPEVWGKTITVVRRFSRTPTYSDGYRIMSEDGKIMKTKKLDLDAVLTQLDIHIDNPIVFLNQKMSKEFFKRLGPPELYQFFYQAYGYETSEEVNQQNAHSLESAKQALAIKEQELAVAKKEVAEWQSRLSEAPSEGNLDLEIKKIELQHAHRKYLDEDQDIRVEENDILDETASAKSDEENLLLEMLPMHALEGENHVVAFSLPENVSELLRAVQDQLENKRKQLAAIKKPTLSTQARALLSATVSQPASSGSRSPLIVDLDRKHAKLDETLGGMDRSILFLEGQLLTRMDLERDLGVVMEELQRMENSAPDWLAYDDDAQCRQDVLSVSRWEGQVPVGPLGSFLTLKTMKNAMAADQAVGPLLSAYLVTHLDDLEKLESIFVKRGCEVPPLIVVDTEVMESVGLPERANMPTYDFSHLLEDALDIGDPFMKTVFLKIFGIGQIAVVDSADRAMQMFSTVSIPNLSKIFDKEGFSYSCHPDDRRISAPLPRCVVKSAEDRNLCLRDLNKRQTSLLKNLSELEDIAEQLEKQRLERDGVVKESCQVQTLLHEQSIELARGRRARLPEVFKSDTTRCTQSSSFSSLEVSSTGLTSLQNDLGEALLTEEIAELADKLPKLQKQERDRKQKLSLHKRSLDKLVRISATLTNLRKRERDLSVQKAANMKILKDLIQEGVDVSSEETALTLEEIIFQKQALKEKQAALMTCSSKYSKEKCEREIRVLQDRLVVIEEHMLKARGLVELRKRNDGMRVNNMAGNVRRGEQMAGERLKAILKDRNFDVELNFDLQRKKLIYRVQPPGGIVGFAPVASLSGGEKAYAMAAFLGALWENRAPFRVLDEFDVFMDQKNRAAALQCLVRQAYYDQVQVIFLSPTDIDLSKIVPIEAISQKDFITRIETVRKEVSSDDDSDS